MGLSSGVRTLLRPLSLSMPLLAAGLPCSSSSSSRRQFVIMISQELRKALECHSGRPPQCKATRTDCCTTGHQNAPWLQLQYILSTRRAQPTLHQPFNIVVMLMAMLSYLARLCIPVQAIQVDCVAEVSLLPGAVKLDGILVVGTLQHNKVNASATQHISQTHQSSHK
jgi:hypothetical protein